MQHYVATRTMFIDAEVMNADTRLVLGDSSSQVSLNNAAYGLSSLCNVIMGLTQYRLFPMDIKTTDRFYLSCSH